MEAKSQQNLTRQIEYYFSDQNLEYDELFHNEIEKNTEYFLSLDMILNCNKIKKLDVNVAEIQDAVRNSSLIELNKAGDSIRRKDKKLPAFKGARKQLKSEIVTRSRKNSQ